MVSCGRVFEWVGFCSTCGAKRKSAWLLHSRKHLLSPVQDVEDPRSLQWTERQFWFAVAMMCVIFECSADTIRRRVETLVNTGDIDETQNCVSLTNVQAFGYNTTTLYNLNVKIVWACFLWRCKKVVDVQSHSDYIVPCTTHQAHAGLRSCWHPWDESESPSL